MPWTKNHQLVSIALTLRPQKQMPLANKIATALHGWFLDQVKLTDQALSAELHDNQSEKAFVLSGILGAPARSDDGLILQAHQPYQLVITGLSKPVCHWLKAWVEDLPAAIEFRRGTQLPIVGWESLQAPTTYAQLLKSAKADPRQKVTLTFLSPTSFRSKGNHLPLPLPRNLFHSYLRRWNAFAAKAAQLPDEAAFLDWVEASVTITRYRLHTQKTAVAKGGLVTGFVGTLELGLSAKGQSHQTFAPYFSALTRFAPYCGTGHKTTFGLGQTRLGEQPVPGAAVEPAVEPVAETIAQAGLAMPVASPEAQQLAQQYAKTALRIEELKQQFMNNRQWGSDRAAAKAAIMATILARREAGESLKAIAQDLRLNYETAKSYCKWARRELETGVVRQR